MTTPRSRTLRDGEHGSVLLAMLAAIIVGGLVATLVGATILGTRTARRDRDYTESINGADTGIQEAASTILRLDDGSQPIGTTVTRTGQVANVSFSFTATKTFGNQWQVTSQGTRAGTTRTVEATIERPAIFFISLFAEAGIDFQGGNFSDSYGHTDPPSLDTGNGGMGSNAIVGMSGNTYADFFMLLGPNASCEDNAGVPTNGGCSSGPQLGFSDPLDLSEAIVQEGLDQCLQAGLWPPTSWTASIDGDPDGDGVAELGPATNGLGHYCFSDLIFDINTVMTGTYDEPVITYLTGILDTGNSTVVNCEGEDPTSSLDDCPTRYARTFQVFTLGTQVYIGNHNDVVMSLYAPQADCGGSPSNAQTDTYGSIICHSVSNQGGWGFHYDDDLLLLNDGPFEVTEYREEVGGTTSN